MIYIVQTPMCPTFFLDSAVQGIVSIPHAERIASDVTGRDCTGHVHALPAGTTIFPANH